MANSILNQTRTSWLGLATLWLCAAGLSLTALGFDVVAALNTNGGTMHLALLVGTAVFLELARAVSSVQLASAVSRFQVLKASVAALALVLAVGYTTLNVLSVSHGPRAQLQKAETQTVERRADLKAELERLNERAKKARYRSERLAAQKEASRLREKLWAPNATGENSNVVIKVDGHATGIVSTLALFDIHVDKDKAAAFASLVVPIVLVIGPVLLWLLYGLASAERSAVKQAKQQSRDADQVIGPMTINQPSGPNGGQRQPVEAVKAESAPATDNEASNVVALADHTKDKGDDMATEGEPTPKERILGMIAEEGGLPKTQKELATELDISQARVSQILRELQADGTISKGGRAYVVAAA